MARATVSALAAQNQLLLERLERAEALLARAVAPAPAPQAAKAPEPGTQEWAQKYAPSLLRRGEQGRIEYLCTVLRKEGAAATFLLYTTSKELLAAQEAAARAEAVALDDDIPF
jgi:hypothetical protein